MLAGIKDILLISTPDDIDKFKLLFGDGTKYGINLTYTIQQEPKGIAEAFVIGKDFIEKDSVCLILGDNIFFGNGLHELLLKKVSSHRGATIFSYYVKDPQNYGVVEFNKNNRVLSINEKPQNPKSHFAVTGLYFYDNKVIEMARNIKPSDRGELEITDINNEYLKIDELEVIPLGRGYAWLDTGNCDNLLDASNYISTLEHRQGLKIGCIEEIALNSGFIDENQFKNILKEIPPNSYKDYLKGLLSSLK
jgi:glucose-1-phosphate thymidylyltransferase